MPGASLICMETSGNGAGTGTIEPTTTRRPQTDPRGAEKGDHRVYRGGGFDHPVNSLHSADRAAKAPTVRYGGLGFRVARTVGRLE